MKKTMKEIRAIVLAAIPQLEYNIRDVYEVDCFRISRNDQSDGNYAYWFEKWVIDEETSDEVLHCLYVLLGLSERDKISKVESQNAAFVEVFKYIKEHHGYRYTYGNGFSNVIDKRLNSLGTFVEKILEAHKVDNDSA
jgi:hypothetical protein